MSLYKFEIQSLSGVEQVLVDGDCNLEMPGFDLDYEQAMFEFDGWENASPAYTLWASWEKLIECIQESTGQTEDLAWMVSWCARLFDNKYFKEIVFSEDKIWSYQLISTICELFRLAFMALENSFCENVLSLLNKVKLYNEDLSDQITFYINIDEPEDSSIKHVAPWTIEGSDERYLMFDRDFLIGPWYRYVGKTITDIFDFGYHDYEFDGEQILTKEHEKYRDKIIARFNVNNRDPYHLPYGFELYIPVQAEPGGCSNFALLYMSRVNVEEIPYGIKSSIAIRYYTDIAEALSAFRLASDIDSKHGKFYDIHMLQRVPYSELVCEQWRERQFQEHKKAGDFLDWVAQNWQEIIPE